ncbi:metallophosphoesterase [Methanobrevibacter sp.]|uniref:metallophosphoesterase n=1 Tax=Methanobrevibacter sp. TaxID=66852 RepID=UPI0025D88577|nr:metallophosphoesterase [Methanobrevibacter sp.]MBQ2666296.1 metallophosphoesterase [Methanobrevibacter sp.]
MKDDDVVRPPVMKIRRIIQDSMNNTLPEKYFNPDEVDVMEVDIELPNLGENFHNYRILNLCDIHLGQWITPEYLDDLIDYVNTLNYDLVTLTGDYVSYILDGYEEALEESFRKLKSQDGKFGVLGNHDHWTDAEKIRKIFKDSDIIDLSNNAVTLIRGDDKLNLGGVDSFTVYADDLNKVLAKLDEDAPTILLAHEPDFAQKSYQTGKIDLQISGHSHGGQFIIPKIETTPLRGNNFIRYPVGLYELGGMYQYTSRGLGTNSFRIRVNCKPEITIITLKTKIRKKIEIE